MVNQLNYGNMPCLLFLGVKTLIYYVKLFSGNHRLLWWIAYTLEVFELWHVYHFDVDRKVPNPMLILFLCLCLRVKLDKWKPPHKRLWHLLQSRARALPQGSAPRGRQCPSQPHWVFLYRPALLHENARQPVTLRRLSVVSLHFLRTALCF